MYSRTDLEKARINCRKWEPGKIHEKMENLWRQIYDKAPSWENIETRTMAN